MQRLRTFLRDDDGRWADLARVVLVYLASRLALALFVWLTGQHYDCHGPRCTDRAFFPKNLLLNALFQWDAYQYAQLARRGYYVGAGFDTTVPYFPGFPVLANTVGRLFGSPLAGGIVLNHLASIGGAFFVTRLSRLLRVQDEGGTVEGTAREASVFWLLAPLTFFYCVFLSESLFAFASAFTFWAVAAGLWPAVLVGSIVATATRNAGVIVVAGAALLAWERRDSVKPGRLGWLCLAGGPLGLLAVLAWQHLVLGNAFAWVAAQRRWNRFLVPPWRTFQDDWLGLPAWAHGAVDKMYRTQEALAMLLTAPLLFLRKRLRLPWGLWLLGVGEWLLPVMSHSLISFARYQAANLYLALAFPAVLSARPMLRAVAYTLFGMVLAWYASTYSFGNWAS